MASFADVENAAPELADRARAVLSSTTNAVLGTIRRDGAPRLSGADPYFHDGQLRIWSMPGARRARTCAAIHAARYTASRGIRGACATAPPKSALLMPRSAEQRC